MSKNDKTDTKETTIYALFVNVSYPDGIVHSSLISCFSTKKGAEKFLDSDEWRGRFASYRGDGEVQINIWPTTFFE